MKPIHLLLALSLAPAVALAGCAADDDSESTRDGANELEQDVTIGGGDNTTGESNMTDDNSTSSTNMTNSTG